MKPKYEIILFWSEDDGAYLAEVPELPGCMADGSTPQKAVANAEKVIAEEPVRAGVSPIFSSFCPSLSIRCGSP